MHTLKKMGFIHLNLKLLPGGSPPDPPVSFWTQVRTALLFVWCTKCRLQHEVVPGPSRYCSKEWCWCFAVITFISPELHCVWADPGACPLGSACRRTFRYTSVFSFSCLHCSKFICWNKLKLSFAPQKPYTLLKVVKITKSIVCIVYTVHLWTFVHKSAHAGTLSLDYALSEIMYTNMCTLFRHSGRTASGRKS